MSLSSLPENCWRVVHHVAHHFARGVHHGLRHGPFHRHPVHHIAHHAAPRAWSEIVCRAVGQSVGGVIVGAGVAGLGYSAGQGLGMQFPDTPPEIVQPFAGGPGGFGSSYSGGGFLYPPYYSQRAYIAPTSELVPPENVVLAPAAEVVPPTISVTKEFPPPPKPVDEPASAILLLTFGMVGAVAIAVSKKATKQ